jgi:hypothetical protein
MMASMEIFCAEERSRARFGGDAYAYEAARIEAQELNQEALHARWLHGFLSAAEKGRRNRLRHRVERLWEARDLAAMWGDEEISDGD